MCSTVHMWEAEANFQELILSYHVGPGNQTQVVTLSGKRPYPWAIFLTHCAFKQTNILYRWISDLATFCVSLTIFITEIIHM